MSGSDGRAAGAAVACCSPRAFVTEMTANFGATASSKVRLTWAGDDGEGAAGLGVGAQEGRVRPRRLRQREGKRRDGPNGEPRSAHPEGHVSGLRPATRPIAPSSTPTAPTTSAATTSSVLGPPLSDEPSTTGLGVSDDSGPFQSTTVPSE